MRHFILSLLPAFSLVAALAAADAPQLQPTPVAAGPVQAETTWEFSLAPEPAVHGAILTIGPIIAIYEGEEYNGRSSGSLTVFGGGCCDTQSGSLKISSDATKVEAAFRGKSFTVSEQGTRLTLGKATRAYVLDGTTKATIRYARNGTVTVTGAAKEPVAKPVTLPPSGK